MLTPIQTAARPAPCGLSGLACPGSCATCPGRTPTLAGGRGLGAFYDTWPAPLNNPLILAALAVAVLLMFGGGFSLFGGKRSGRRNAKLRLIQARAAEKRAELLAS